MYKRIILVIIWMIIIFAFSNQPAVKSTNQSDKVVDLVVKIVNVKKEIITKELATKLIKPIRKSAHFFLYFVLGLLVYNVIKYNQISSKDIFILSILICILYACGDEIHQLFVKGRSGSVIDVFIDSIGSLSSIYLYKKLQNK